MPQVAVTINGRNYQIACDDGQEEHLSELAEYVDKRVQELVATLGQIGDTRLLVMASLLVADELSEAFAAQERDRASAMGGEETLARIIESTAHQIENIAAGLERA